LHGLPPRSLVTVYFIHVTPHGTVSRFTPLRVNRFLNDTINYLVNVLEGQSQSTMHGDPRILSVRRQTVVRPTDGPGLNGRPTTDEAWPEAQPLPVQRDMDYRQRPVNTSPPGNTSSHPTERIQRNCSSTFDDRTNTTRPQLVVTKTALFNAPKIPRHLIKLIYPDSARHRSIA
jgi:hypothetical protein